MSYDVQLIVETWNEFEKREPTGKPCDLCEDNIYSHDNVLIWVVKVGSEEIKKEMSEVYCDSCIMEIIKTK